MRIKGNVLVEVFNVLARITPSEVDELLEPELTVTTTRFVPGGSLGYRKEIKPERLFRRCESDICWFPAGLVPQVVARLKDAGFHVVVERRHQLDARASTNPEMFTYIRGVDREFAEVLEREPRGLIGASKEAEVVHLVALICWLFPRARILIALNSSRSKAQEFRNRLEGAGAGPVCGINDYAWPWEGGRLVCGLTDLANVAKHQDPLFDVVLLPDVLQAAAPRYIDTFARLNQQRVYGFLQTNATVSPRTLTQMKVMIGPSIFRTPAPRGEEAATRVLWTPPPWSAGTGAVSPLDRKRSGYWKNDPRNDFIATIARAFSIGDKEALWKCGLLLSESDSFADVGRGVAVSILVESSEHGRELLRRLPDWELATMAPTLPHGGTGAPRNPWRIRAHDKVIMTFQTASSMDYIDPQVLLLAGPEWPFALKGFPLRSQEPDCQAMVVDLADDFDLTAQAAVRRRLREYSSRRWQTFGAPSWAVRDDGDATVHHTSGRRRKVRRK